MSQTSEQRDNIGYLQDNAGIQEPLGDQHRQTERTFEGHQKGRDMLREWVKRDEENVYLKSQNLQHSVAYHFGEQSDDMHQQLADYGEVVTTDLEYLVRDSDFRFNNPSINPYSGIGDRIDEVVHHPSYNKSGNYIYGTDMIAKMATPGKLLEGLSLYYLSCYTGDAGHHCPVVCNFETSRVLKIVDDFPQREEYIRMLEEPSYDGNWTSSQFLTEIQGGSDVVANDTRAWQDEEGNWFIRGEKWFCSNANAELMVISARRSIDRKGTKGLSMFLIPSHKPDGSRNDYTLRRLKEKMGTKALASAEMDFHDAWAIPLGGNFNFMLEKVIHYSRISLATAVLGFTSRAFNLAHDFAMSRKAFGQTIKNYPLVQENLAGIKADHAASLAGMLSLIALQDKLDTWSGEETDELKDEQAFSRLMSNIGKSVISKRSVNNIHHCLDGIGGNGAIEGTSALPRLLRDCVIYENWEGTHNTIYMQVFRDFNRYQHDQAYLRVMTKRIAELPQQQRTQAEASMTNLKNLLAELKAADQGLQTLLMARVVTQMANLYYFVCLLEEGNDQQTKDGGDNKLHCAALFQRLFLAEKNNCDTEYMTLCRQVVEV